MNYKQCSLYSCKSRYIASLEYYSTKQSIDSPLMALYKYSSASHSFNFFWNAPSPSTRGFEFTQSRTKTHICVEFVGITEMNIIDTLRAGILQVSCEGSIPRPVKTSKKEPLPMIIFDGPNIWVQPHARDLWQKEKRSTLLKDADIAVGLASCYGFDSCHPKCCCATFHKIKLKTGSQDPVPVTRPGMQQPCPVLTSTKRSRYRYQWPSTHPESWPFDIA